MTLHGLLWAQDHTVAMDYGHFYLQHRVVGDDLDDEAYDDLDLSDLISRANDGDGIAWEAGTLAVLSPHQCNFEMPLRVELRDSKPAADLDDWEEAFEAYLKWENGGLTYSSPTVDSTDFPVPPGAYHVLITGRGFVAHGWPGNATPGDSWRLQLWPGNPPAWVPARRLRDWRYSITVDVDVGGEPIRVVRGGVAHQVADVEYASPAPGGRRFYQLDVRTPAGASAQARLFAPNAGQAGRWELQAWQTR
jgi:hypothetical protein